MIAGRRSIPGLNRVQSEKVLIRILEMMVSIGRGELRNVRIDGKKIPPLYKSGVRYARERGTEIWKDPVETFLDGYGDCEDLATWRVAELLNNHKFAAPFIRYRVDPVTGMYIYHVMVKRKDGRLEDPSRILGMTGRD